MSDTDNPYKAPETEQKQHSVPEGAAGGHTSTMAVYLKQTRPWVRLLSILGFIWIGFMIIAALVMIVGSGSAELGNIYGALMGVVYLLLAVLYVIPVVYLHRYAGSITRFLASETSEEMENALRYQKSFWKFSGILALITIVVGLIAFAVVMGSVATGILA